MRRGPSMSAMSGCRVESVLDAERQSARVDGPVECHDQDPIESDRITIALVLEDESDLPVLADVEPESVVAWHPRPREPDGSWVDVLGLQLAPGDRRTVARCPGFGSQDVAAL